MKKLTLVVIIFILVALPFIFAKIGSDQLEVKGYNVEIEEKSEIYYDNAKCTDCDVSSTEVHEINKD